VWDLNGTSRYYKVTDKLFLPKKVKLIMKMKYHEMENAKPVYILLLKLFRLSDNEILSRNFYWLRLPGQDYKLLEQYQQKRIPLLFPRFLFQAPDTSKEDRRAYVEEISSRKHTTYEFRERK
jgi:hypothetical protein